MAIPVVILIALATYSAFPHPTSNQVILTAVAVESQRLIVNNAVGVGMPSVYLPKEKWPPTIASLKPYSVIVRHYMVDMTTRPYFDGGWGYGFAADKRNLTMFAKCWSELGQNIYWHGPC
ncbi:hypothetical protein [Sphingomonas sp. Leaf17]|uniref:hypothetical protein n=1 Tax=Sphingomonas sp. Leaf17 TaxID=1735683 RepID=UPI0012E0F7D0|nr:hypothetical protein [Sphingomonas sp. Leaf17]